MAAPTDFQATEGASFSGGVATVTDPDSAAVAGEYTAAIDWGDASSSTGTVSGPTGGPFTISGTHTYADQGTYTATVTITDTDTAANSQTVMPVATVADAALGSSCATPTASTASFSGSVAGFTDANPGATTADFTAAIDWGDGSSSTGTVSGPTGGPFTVSGSHNYGSTGPEAISVTIDDEGGSTSTASGCNVLIYSSVPGGGAFVIGDQSTTGTVTFWGAEWWKLNSLSGGPAPSAFKGYASSPATPSCGVDWTTDPGNAAPPPAAPLPGYMAVIVAGSIGKSGSAITGDTLHLVVVKTNPGYDSNPGHAGTGTVVAQIC